MARSDGEALVDQATDVARYDTLRELANQLTGLFVAREREARSPGEAETWRSERRRVRNQLDEIEPGTPNVAVLLAEWSARLIGLRGQER